MITSRQINCFCEVAKYLNFRKAAEGLYISQSVVTYHINELEKELGVKLFSRSPHLVVLTAAGKSLYQDVVLLQRQFEKAVAKAKSIQDSARPDFIMGTSKNWDQNDYVELAKLFQNHFPQTRLLLRPAVYLQSIKELKNGELSLLFCHEEEVAEQEDIEYLPIREYHHYCHINKNNPLSKKPHIYLEDLEGQTLILPQRAKERNALTLVYQEIIDSNLPVHLHFEDSFELAQAMLLSNLAILLGPLGVKGKDSLIKKIPYGSYEPHKIGIAWRRDDESRQTLQLVEIIREYYCLV